MCCSARRHVQYQEFLHTAGGEVFAEPTSPSSCTSAARTSSTPTKVTEQTMTDKKRIAVVPGDGIGKEVIEAALGVVKATGAAVEFTHFDWSADRYLKDGATVPKDGFEMLGREFDAVFVGALGDPRVPSNVHA